MPRPTPTGPYLAASSAYRAGFRGQALVVMTAISGRESSWDPGSVNPNDPAGGSFGLWQINGAHNPNGGVATQSWGAQLLNPLVNALYAWNVAGGNQMSGVCQNWYVDPSTGQSCGPGANNPNYGAEYQMHYAQAQAAAQEVEQYGPAPVNEIALWAHNAGFQGTISGVPNSIADATTGGGPGSTGSGTAGDPGCCGHGSPNDPAPCKPWTFPHTSFGFTYCEYKALGGAAFLVAGGALFIGGLALIVVAGLGNTPAAQAVVGAAAPVAGAAKAAGGRAKRAVSSRTASRRTAKATTPVEEPISQKEYDERKAQAERQPRPTRARQRKYERTSKQNEPAPRGFPGDADYQA